jgi:hypothetical protein
MQTVKLEINVEQFNHCSAYQKDRPFEIKIQNHILMREE